MRRILNLYNDISNKSYSTLAGSIAFFLIVNGGSVVCLVINICNNIGYDVLNYFDTSYLPTQIETIIEVIYVSSTKSNFSIFFTITSLISGSTLFYHLIKITEIIYGEKKYNRNIYSRILSVIIVILFLLLVITLFILYLLCNLLTKGTPLNLLTKYLTMLLAPFLITLFICSTITPKAKIKNIYKGVMFTTLFWFIITFLFSIYLNIFFNFKMSYGSLSFFIVFMIWVYLLSQGLVIGFILNFNKNKNNT